MGASQNDIALVLQDMRKAIDCGAITLIPRRKNMLTLARLGILWEDAKDEVYHLTVADYFSGPSVDRDFPNMDKLWVFKKRILGETIYIKFKVAYKENGEARVISFHIDEVG